MMRVWVALVGMLVWSTLAVAQTPPAELEVVPAAPVNKSTEANTPAEPEPFYKGELGTPGAPDLANSNDAIFLGLGYYNIGGVLGQHFARLTPQVDLHFEVAPQKLLTLRLAVPLNMTLYDRVSTAENKGLGTMRKNDYDELGDYFKFIRQIQLGRKEDKLYANVGLTRAVSLGHGTVMRRYNANLDPNHSRLGIQFDAYNDYGGFETFLADISFASPIVGGLVFAKPFSLFSDNPILRTFSLGVHYTSDLRAPKALKRDANNRVLVDSAGYPRYSTTQVSIIGVDSEIKPLKLGNLLDLKMYADYSQIVGAGGGMSAGLLLRGNLGARPLLSALRMRVEGRLYAAAYRPEYFNSAYEIKKLQMGPGQGTQYQEIVKSTGTSGHASVYAEASYSLVDQLSLGLGLERIVDLDQYNMLVHIEIPAFEFLRLYASYQKFYFNDLGKAFAQAPGKSFAFEPDAILFSQARVMLLPILFVSAGLRQQFLWNETQSAYVPNLDYLVETQLGFEF